MRSFPEIVVSDSIIYAEYKIIFAYELVISTYTHNFSLKYISGLGTGQDHTFQNAF